MCDARKYLKQHYLEMESGLDEGRDIYQEQQKSSADGRNCTQTWRVGYQRGRTICSCCSKEAWETVRSGMRADRGQTEKKRDTRPC